MEIEGKIIAVLQKQEGVSARTGNHWASQEYVLETHDQFPRKCCFRIFGEERINTMNIQAGEELRVSFDIDAREYNGRYFNTLTAWKVDRIDPNAVVQMLCRIVKNSMFCQIKPPQIDAFTFGYFKNF
ncbi:MAG: DUF3127 domain-containing protein [Prevotella sp.]|nr:DUF3127 domain-containing protein [Prevotella sp.]